MPEQRPPSVLFDLVVAYQKVSRLLQLSFEGAGVAAEDFPIYSELSNRHGVTTTELAGALGMRRSTFTFRFNRIVERGHGRRVPDPRDRRATLLELTPAGQRAAEEAIPRFREVLGELVRGLSIPRSRVGVALADLAAAADGALERHREADVAAGTRR